MNQHLIEQTSSKPPHIDLSRRLHNSAEDALILSELDPHMVVDHLDPDSAPLDLTAFGSVRETCPNCRDTHLKLVLRQGSVRIAHLFCVGCECCFDAHYPNGAPALTI